MQNFSRENVDKNKNSDINSLQSDFISDWSKMKVVADERMDLSLTNDNICLSLTLHLICQFWGLPIQQPKKICCQKCGQMGIQLSD